MFAGVAVVIGGGCFVGSSSEKSVTFHKDVEPILQQHCQSCHTTGGIAPFTLASYDDAKGKVGVIVSMTQSKLMPPWGAQETSTCKPRMKWTHDPRLSQAELDTLKKWSTTGTLEGDPKDAPAALSQQLGLTNTQMELTPPTPYTVIVENNDSFRCFVLDPKLAQDSWINGTNIIPGNAEVVHHVVVFTDPVGETKKKKLGPDNGYDCFGGVGISNTSVLMAWAPGMTPQEFPPDVGTEITKGTLLVAQVHYHPHGAAGSGGYKPDVTKLQLRFNSSTPKWALVSELIGNFSKTAANGDGFSYDKNDPNALSSFVIPANAKDKTVTQKFVVPPVVDNKPTPPLFLYGIGGHMHWAGTHVDINLHRLAPADNEPQDECLMGIPQWDFNWQRIYHYDAPSLEQLPSLKQFDQLTIKCNYDNTLDNPKVAEALKQQGITQPREIALGETTLDEMCLGIFQIVTRVP